MSPCELLNLRDKFRQAPPSNLDEQQNTNIEGHFGTLITVFHIRKLLSSHGVRPAYEMLHEKLCAGYVAGSCGNIFRLWLSWYMAAAIVCIYMQFYLIVYFALASKCNNSFNGIIWVVFHLSLIYMYCLSIASVNGHNLILSFHVFCDPSVFLFLL